MAGESPFEVRLTDDGFKVLRKGRLHTRVRWADVRGIAAFKRDLFTVDEICLSFRLQSLDEVWLGEDDAGFSTLEEAVAARYPDHDPNWRGKVMLPPFETCWTVVWGDAPQMMECPKCGYDLRGSEEARCPECGHTFPADVCRECAGTGRFRSWVLVKWGAIVAVAGVGLLVGSFLLRGVLGWFVTVLQMAGGAAAVFGSVAAVVNLTDYQTTCRACRGTGHRRADAIGQSRAEG